MFRLILLTLIVLSIPQLAPAQCRDALPATLFGWGEAPAPLGELGPIVTDRPDFTEASSTVGLGVIQIEAGYTLAFDGDSSSHSWGEPLVRAGVLANWLELRIAAFPTSNSIDRGSSRPAESGLEDLYLGMKIGLTPQAGILPELAVMPQMTIPTGHSSFTSDRVLPGLNLLYGWDITETYSFGGSTQYNSAVDDAQSRYDEWAQSLTVGRSITDELASYLEWFAFFPHSAIDTKPEHYLNGGFTFLATDDVQFDIRAGMGLSDAAEDFFVGSGVSVRFH